MTIDEERVCDVLRNNAGLIHIYIVYVINDVDATALAGICRLHNPYVFLTLMLLQLLVVVVEVAKFVGQDVGVRAEVKSILTESFLKPYYVKAKPILAGDLVTLGKVINLLVLIKTLILIALA